MKMTWKKLGVSLGMVLLVGVACGPQKQKADAKDSKAAEGAEVKPASIPVSNSNEALMNRTTGKHLTKREAIAQGIQPCNGQPGKKIGTNGFVADTADVEGGTIADNAWVCDTAWVKTGAYVGHDAWILGNSLVTRGAVVYQDAVIHGNAVIQGEGVQVYGNAQVSGNNSWVHSDADIYENAIVKDDADISEGSQVYGNAVVGGVSKVSGGAHVTTAIVGNVTGDGYEEE